VGIVVGVGLFLGLATLFLPYLQPARDAVK
jgi:hypothetical protein